MLTCLATPHMLCLVYNQKNANNQQDMNPKWFIIIHTNIPFHNCFSRPCVRRVCTKRQPVPHSNHRLHTCEPAPELSLPTQAARDGERQHPRACGASARDPTVESSQFLAASRFVAATIGCGEFRGSSKYLDSGDVSGEYAELRFQNSSITLQPLSPPRTSL